MTGNGSHTIQFHATDNAGNVEAIKTKSFTVDGSGPVITITSPAGTYTLNQSVTPSYSCSDSAGVGSCSGPGTVDTGSIGSKSYTVNASDLVGNTSSLTRTYNVHLAVHGLLRSLERQGGLAGEGEVLTRR